MTKNLKPIAFEQIEGDIWYGYYGPYKVIMRKSNGWVNIGKLDDEHKKMYPAFPMLMWSNTRCHTNLCEAIAKRDGVGEEYTMQAVYEDIYTDDDSTADRLISGTYMHPDLLPHYLSYTNPEFALEASIIINKHLIEQFQKRRDSS